MGLDDAIGNSTDDDDDDNSGGIKADPPDIPELDGDIKEYLEKIKSLSAVLANMDGRIEDVQDDIRDLNNRVKAIESATGDVDSSDLARLYDRQELLDAVEELDDQDDSGSLWDSTS